MYFPIYSQAEVKWVIRLQFVLLVVLLLGAGDFAIGSFTHSDPGPIKSDNNEFYKDVYVLIHKNYILAISLLCFLGTYYP